MSSALLLFIILFNFHHDHVYEHDEHDDCLASVQDDRDSRPNVRLFLGALEVLFIHSFIHHLGMSDALCHTGLSSVAIQ